MTGKVILRNIFISLIFVCFSAGAAFAQTTEFTYQGKLTDAGTSSPTYDFEFRLCDTLADDCTAPLAVQQKSGVPVSIGVFTVNLDFGSGVFDGTDRWLEIAVKRPSEGNYITLAPRQSLTSAPYAIRALSAANADSTALFGGFTTDDFIQNTTSQQIGNFNISGTGIIGDNLGIGIVPQSGIRLDVAGNSIFRTANGNINLGTPLGETGMTISQTNRADIRFDNSTLKLLAGTGTGAMASTNGININTLGNVGIGTVSPSTKLDVAGNIFSSGSLTVNSAANIGGGLSVGNGINVSNGLSVNSGNMNAAGGATVTGNMTVSNKITTDSLRVNNGFSFATIGGSYTQDICRDIIVGTLGQCGTSLRRYKMGIENFGGGLSLVNRLRPVSFIWKESGQRDVGFIAEEVFEIEPLLTTTDENGELAGVKYKQLNVVFVNAIKEQQQQIEQQNEQIGRQQTLLETQQKQIDGLIKLVCMGSGSTEICREN